MSGVIERTSTVYTETLEPSVKYGTPGLFEADLTGANPGGEAFWRYAVPRYFSDPIAHEGKLPESFLTRMTLTDVAWHAESEKPSPYLYMGLWGPSSGWASLYSHEGLSGHSINNMAYVYNFPNELSVPDVKTAQIGLYSTESVSKGWTYLYVGAATVEMSEPASTIPKFAELYGPSEWVNQKPASVQFKAEDAGLGVSSLTISGEQGSNPPSWKTTYSCTGVPKNPCPYTRNASVNIEPGLLPTGIDKLKVVAADPVGHVSTHEVNGAPVDAHVGVMVDHTGPEISLGGSITEQGKIGSKLIVNAGDGTAAAPQSGVAKATVSIDGNMLYETSPGCSIENCSISRNLTLDVSSYSSGTHTLEVTATDAVGNSTTKKQSIYLQQTPAPTVSLSGTITEQASIGTTRPRYKLNADVAAQAGEFGPSTYSATFGSYGTGNGAFNHPAGMAVDAKGFLWVADWGNSRIEKFKENGEYVAKFGIAGSASGQISHPSDVAIDPKGNFWIADSGNNRIDEFNEKYGFVQYTDGSIGTGTPFSEPAGIATDSKGSVWVADTHRARLVEFNSSGEVLRVAGNKGELAEPAGIDIGLDDEVWVADRGKNQILEFSETGQLLHQFSSGGSALLQFQRPDTIDVDVRGNVWVGEEGINRVQELDLHGEYLGQFGSEGSGSGQFRFSFPMGITTDKKGHILVADASNNRVQKWAMPSYVPVADGSLGSAGSGSGQFSHPAGITIDASGNLWVADDSNHRLEEFNEAGEYLRSLGSEGTTDGHFIFPRDVAIDASGRLWVADAATCRVQAFSQGGNYITTIRTSDSSQESCTAPEALAIDKEGHIWVADTYHARLEEFNEAGQRLKVFGTKGYGEGQLYEPTGIAIGPGGNIWTVDWFNDRVLEFTPEGALVLQFGSEGSGTGKFKQPDVIDIDERGNVWVADEKNNRVEEFNHKGEYIAQFGSAGTGPGQFKFLWPMGIATDSNGNLWVADPKNNRVEKWNYANVYSEIEDEVLVDGKQVESTRASCITNTCPISTTWTLEAGSYLAGEHVVKVKATDGLGRSTTHTVDIGIQRDTTKPTLELSGNLANAPDGWVEQKSYNLAVSATDQGGGVTSLIFKIDGNVISSESQGCVEGGCNESTSKSVNMANYDGGSHSAEVTAKDGAGNVASKSWTINVDPAGHITTDEAADTLEAADATSESTVVASTGEVLDPEQIEGGDNPSLHLSGSEITSTGVPDTTTMTTNLGDGFTIHSPEGSTTITPIVNENSSAISITEGVAGVAANTGNEVDSVIRPEYNGVQTFQAIRSASSPEKYSWQVHLAPRQELLYVNPAQAEVVYNDGVLAFLITAENAHDATGNPVPTSLEVNGNVVTLRVEFHSGAFVYPIESGQGWETSYKVPFIVEGPEDEAQIREREERERAEREAAEGGEEVAPPPPSSGYFSLSEAQNMMKTGAVEEIIPAPTPSSGGGASASSVNVKTVKPFKVCQQDHCSIWHVELKNPSYFYKLNSNNRLTAWWEPGTQVHSSWYYPWYYAPEINVEGNGCGFVSPGQVWEGEHKHLTIWGRYTISASGITSNGDVITERNYLALQIWVWPNGYQQRVEKHWTPNPEIQEA